MSSFDELQEQVGEWGKQTFPKSTRHTILTHMKRELKELAGSNNSRTDREECADILLLLLHLAHRMGFSLHGEAKRKFGVCLTRGWAEPDAEGVVEHIRQQATVDE